MRHISICRGLLAVLVLGWGISSLTIADPVANAARRARSKAVQDDRRQNQNYSKALQQSQAAIQKDRQELAEALTDLATARNALRLAAKHKSQVTDDATRRAEQKSGLERARREHEAARHTLDEASPPVLDELRKTPEYAAAVAKADRAKSVLSESRDEKHSNDPDQSSLRQAASLDTFAATQLERETLAKDSRTADLVTRLEAARKSVADLHRGVQQSVKDDPKVRTAERQVTEARRELEAKAALVAAVGQKIAAAEVRLSQGIADGARVKSPARSKSTARKSPKS